MLIPNPIDSSLSLALYLLLIFIIYKGLVQYLQLRKDSGTRIRSLLPLGAIGVILGIIGYIRGYRMAFAAISAAGDISPELVSSAFGESGGYPILGLVCLLITFFFKYINQY